jgi:hypothetical protein
MLTGLLDSPALFAQDLTPQHVANVLICSVRPCPKAELPYVFEVVSPNKRTYTLQVCVEF